MGALSRAEAKLQKLINIFIKIKDKFYEATHRTYLSRVLMYQGSWSKAEGELAQSRAYWKSKKHIQGICLDESYRALYALLTARDRTQSSRQNQKKSATTLVQRAQHTVQTLVDLARLSTINRKSAITHAKRARELVN